MVWVRFAGRGVSAYRRLLDDPECGRLLADERVGVRLSAATIARGLRGVRECRDVLEGVMSVDRRECRPKPAPSSRVVAGVLRDTATDIDRGVDPVLVSLRLRNLAGRIDPTYKGAA